MMNTRGEIVYILVVYIPSTHTEEVKEALFAAGAGTLGSYSRCSFEVQGTGQFMPLEDAHPFLGEKGVCERVDEVRVEMAVREDVMEAVIKALRAAHPYEVPAYHYYEVLT